MFWQEFYALIATENLLGTNQNTQGLCGCVGKLIACLCNLTVHMSEIISINLNKGSCIVRMVGKFLPFISNNTIIELLQL